MDSARQSGESVASFEHHKTEVLMARIAGLEKNQAPWHLRWFYGVMRKMFGKDLTPAKMQMRMPGIIWGSVAMEAGLSKRRRVSLRYIQLAKVRTAARVGCPF
jgi:hypothetical protein